MARLDYSQAVFPSVLRQVADLTSVTLAVRLAREFGGHKLYFPRRPWANHAIAKCIGFTALERLCEELAGEEFILPAATTYLRWLDSRALMVLGLRKPEIARVLKVTPRHLNHLTKGFDPADIEIDETILLVGRYYRIAGKRPETRRSNGSFDLQQDFGWPIDEKGMRFKRDDSASA